MLKNAIMMQKIEKTIKDGMMKENMGNNGDKIAMMKKNTLYPAYDSLKRPKNWISNIGIFFKRLHNKHERAVQGYCHSDLWDFDHYLLTVFTNGLKDLANDTIAYPGTEEFPTPESWENYLKEMAQLFYQADESNNYYPTPKFDEWYKESLNKNIDELLKDDGRKEIYEESKENNIKREEDFKKAWEMMGKVFFHLWY